MTLKKISFRMKNGLPKTMYVDQNRIGGVIVDTCRACGDWGEGYKFGVTFVMRNGYVFDEFFLIGNTPDYGAKWVDRFLSDVPSENDKAGQKKDAETGESQAGPAAEPPEKDDRAEDPQSGDEPLKIEAMRLAKSIIDDYKIFPFASDVTVVIGLPQGENDEAK